MDSFFGLQGISGLYCRERDFLLPQKKGDMKLQIRDWKQNMVTEPDPLLKGVGYL